MTATAGESKGSPTPTPETQARVARIACWLVEGNGTRECYALASEAWGISSRQTDRLLQLARLELRHAWQVDRADMVAVLMSRSDAVFRLAMEQRNSGAAIAAISTAAKIAQL
jgi:hypothetical protein